MNIRQEILKIAKELEALGTCTECKKSLDDIEDIIYVTLGNDLTARKQAPHCSECGTRHIERREV